MHPLFRLFTAPIFYFLLAFLIHHECYIGIIATVAIAVILIIAVFLGFIH